MKRLAGILMALSLVVGAGVGVIAEGVTPASASTTQFCHASKDGTQLCASSKTDLEVEIAANNLSVALGPQGVKNTAHVRFDAPSLNACLQVGRLPSKDATKYLGNYTCEWIN